jgi:hypothetical protein
MGHALGGCVCSKADHIISNTLASADEYAVIKLWNIRVWGNWRTIFEIVRCPGNTWTIFFLADNFGNLIFFFQNCPPVSPDPSSGQLIKNSK